MKSGSMHIKPIAVLGAGGWGTTLALLLDGKGYNVRLWEYRRLAAERLQLERENVEFLPGIPLPERERVFQRFYRLDSSRSTAGAGLGLSLVAAVVEQHHGQVRLEDNEPGLRAVMRLRRAGVSRSSQTKKRG